MSQTKCLLTSNQTKEPLRPKGLVTSQQAQGLRQSKQIFEVVDLILTQPYIFKLLNYRKILKNMAILCPSALGQFMSKCPGQFMSKCPGQFMSKCPGQFMSKCPGQFMSKCPGQFMSKCPGQFYLILCPSKIALYLELIEIQGTWCRK